MSAPVALTGTPGTGKSTVAAALSPGFRAVEVADLALTWGVARRSEKSVTVDLAQLRERFRRNPPSVDLVVGHLAHLLPVRDVVVLRCHPEELANRLSRSGRGSSRDWRENYVAEALDVVLVEAVRPRRRVWEVDTTGRSPALVARGVRRLLRRRPPSHYGRIDWLSDPKVTEHLLETDG